MSGNPLTNDLEARWELPRQSLSCIRVGTLVGLSLLHLAGTGTHSRPSQISSCHTPSWHLCVSIPADLSDPVWAIGGPPWSQFDQDSLVCPCSGILLIAPFWIINYMVIQLSEFGLQTHCFQTSQGHPRDGQQEGHTFVPIRKIQKAFKIPVAGLPWWRSG